MQNLQPSLQPLQQLFQYTRMLSPQQTLTAHDVNTTIPKAPALQQARNAITYTQQAITQPSADDPEVQEPKGQAQTKQVLPKNAQQLQT